MVISEMLGNVSAADKETTRLASCASDFERELLAVEMQGNVALIARRLALLDCFGQHDGCEILDFLHGLEPDNHNLHLAALLHDIGKTGPLTICEDASKLITRAAELAQTEVTRTVVRLYGIAVDGDVGKRTTIAEFLRHAEEQGKLSTTEKEQLQSSLKTIVNPFPNLPFHPEVDIMGDFWDAHTLWGVQILEANSVQREVINIVSQHHRIDVYATDSFVLFVDVDNDTITRIPAGEATEDHKQMSHEGKLLLISDKFNAFVKRSDMGSAQAMDIVTDIIRRSAVGQAKFEPELREFRERLVASPL